MEPKIQKPNTASPGGDSRSAFGMTIKRHLTPQETNGALFVIENVTGNKGGPPRHIHDEQDEWFFVLEGEYVVEVGDRTHHLRVGESVLAPRRIPHVWAQVNAGVGRILITFQPAGDMEAFFEKTTSLVGSPDPETMRELFRTHGMQLVGPPLQAPST